MASQLTFTNDDYNYLINNHELRVMCEEALIENGHQPTDLQFLSSTTTTTTTTTSSSKLSSPATTPTKPTSSSLPSSSSSSTSSNYLRITGSLPVVTLNNDTTKSNSDVVSLKEFSKWLTRTEQHLKSVCYCSFHPGNVNLNSLKPIKTKLDQSNWIGAIDKHKVIQTEIQSVGRHFINSLKANASKIDQSLLTAHEDRWLNLWLNSLEYSMLVEEFQICPNHTTWNRERSSTPHSNSKRFKLGPFSEGKENIKGMMRNRRIQTMIGMGAGPGLNETFNVPNGKYEIIHKDIGYSSDADMSDACEPASCPTQVNANAKSPRKRHRRRRPRVGRPWSFHSEWAGWDYIPLHLGGGEYRSSEDLNSFEDENLVRSLTEFGENYESWFKTDDGLLRASEDLASHEEECSSRSLTDSLGTHSDRSWSKGSHGGGNYHGNDSKSKLLRGKKNKFFTSSPNITCSSINGTETADLLDFTIESQHNSGAKIQVASVKPMISTSNTFIIKDSGAINKNNNNNNAPDDDDDDDDDDNTEADVDVIRDNLIVPNYPAKAQPETITLSSADDDDDNDDDNDEENNIAIKSNLKPSATFLLHPSSPPHQYNTSNYNANSTQTTQTYSQLISKSTLTSTSTSTTTLKTTSTKYFFIYLTITLLMAVILSLLVTTLSPISPHVQKSYPNRSPPN